MPEGFEALSAILNGTPAPAPAPATPAPETKPADPAPQPAPATEPAAPAAAAPAPETTPAPAPAPETPAATPEPVEAPDKVFDSPSNRAFAQLRTENAKMTGLLARLGTVLGLDKSTPPEQLIDTLTQRLMATEAQQNNVPVEILQRLEKAEQDRLQNEQAMLQQQATLAFQNVKTTYNLTDAQLRDFAQQLRDSGKNPFLQPMDLVMEYRNVNFEKILAAERERAVQEALARDKKAAEQSTTPPSASGRPSEPPTRIDSIAGLNAILSGN